MIRFSSKLGRLALSHIIAGSENNFRHRVVTISTSLRCYTMRSNENDMCFDTFQGILEKLHLSKIIIKEGQELVPYERYFSAPDHIQYYVPEEEVAFYM